MINKSAIMRSAVFGVLLGLGTGQAAAELPANVMAQFNQLSPAQQEAVAAQYGVDINEIRSQSSSSAIEAPMSQTLTPRTLDPNAPSQRAGLGLQMNGQLSVDPNQLQPFGYNVFAAQPTSQTPLADIPVPDDYVVGPGDELRVQMYGKENASYKLKVNRDGSVEFPKLGPINVAGQTFEQVSGMLQQRISEQFIGVESAIGMGALRTMQIFVMGDAYQPGAYNVNALTTVTQALQIAGGVDTVGSLRKIQVKRGGQVVQNVDLYKMLIWGDTSQDIRLRAGDTIFIPAKGTEVIIDGLVKRPAIYELSGSAALSKVMEVAGGLKAEALREVSLTRRGQDGVQVFNLNLANGHDSGFMVRDGDHIEAKPTTTEFSRAISVKGAVVREGTYSYQSGMRVSQLLKDVRRDLKTTADLDYALIVREINPRRDIEVLQFNLGRAITQPLDFDDLQLQPRDQVLVFEQGGDLYSANGGVYNSPKQGVPAASNGTIGNNNVIYQPGQTGQNNQIRSNIQTGQGYPAAQNYQNSSTAVAQAFAGSAISQERARQHQQSKVVDSSTGAVVSKAELEQGNKTMDLSDMALGGASTKLVVNSRQDLLAPVIEKLKTQSSLNNPVQIAEVRGEVKFPGVYPIARNATQADLLVAAGGLKETAFAAELSRVDEDSSGALNISYQRFDLTELNARTAPKAQSKDSLNVLANPDWRGQATVQLFG